MKIVFNDLTELQIQKVALDGNKLDIRTVSATPEELRKIFTDELKTKKMKVVEQGQTLAEYENYTILDGLTEYNGKIYGVFMYEKGKTPEDSEEKIVASVVVASIQAQTLADADALRVKALYPEWDGSGVKYEKGFYLVYSDVLYKVLQAHTSQLDWAPDVAVSLFAKVLVDPEGDVLPWEQPESTNPYAKGDRVEFEGEIWVSTSDGNVWKPGVYGWTKE